MVCVIVVTHNSATHLPGFLDSLSSAGSLDLRVIVVDNASTDASAAVARAAGATVIEAGENRGYAAGINLGRARTSGCDAVFVANPDLRIGPGALEALAAVAIGEDGVAVPRILAPDGRTRRSLFREPTIGRQLGEAVLGDHWPGRPSWLSEIVREEGAYRSRHRADWATGAALMVSARCDRTVGPWDESYFLFSEEVDYASRVRRHGFGLTYVPTAEVTHAEGGSGRPGPLMDLAATNKIRYVRARHGRAYSAVYALAVLLQLLLRASEPGHRRAVRPTAAGARALVAGAPGVIESTGAAGALGATG